MKLRKYRYFGGMLYEGGGERTGEGIVETCVKDLTIKEDIGTTHRLKRCKGMVLLGLFRINLSCILWPIPKEER